jgi:hypothetical protein
VQLEHRVHRRRVKAGMSEADVHRLLGKPFIETDDRKIFEGYLFPAHCLSRAMKAELYKRFMGAQFAIAYDKKGTVTCTMHRIVD